MPSFDPLPRSRDIALILIVDDEPRNIQVAGSLFLHAGHEISAAGSGEEALAQMRIRPPDLVLLDAMMPGISGFELCRMMKQDSALVDIPVIFLSAVADKSFVMEALEAGAVDYVTKPFHRPELMSRVTLHLSLLQARRRLSTSIVERNHVLEVVAHDLKNPLGAVQFAASLLLEARANLPERELALAENIHESAQRALEIVESLLETRQLEDVKSALGKVALCLKEYTDEAVAGLRQHSRKKRIDLQICTPEGEVLVYGDRRSLLCVLENLLSNAVKFSPVGSTVIATVTRGNGNHVFTVEDQGPGVKDEEIDRLFTKFTRLSARPTGGEVSTGLGLHIVRELVNAMSGTVEYSHREGGGARFQVSLPSADAEV